MKALKRVACALSGGALIAAAMFGSVTVVQAEETGPGSTVVAEPDWGVPPAPAMPEEPDWG